MSKELLKLNDTTDDQFVMIREFSAPKSLVFEVLTRSEHIVKWSCPKSMKVTFSETELKVGGAYKFGMRSVSNKGAEMILAGVYREIDEPNKIVYTQIYQMPDGNSSPETLITITLDEDKGITQMIFHHTGFMSKQGRDNARMGWEEAFDKIVSILSSN